MKIEKTIVRELRPLGLLGILGLMGLGLQGCSSEDAEEQTVAIPIELTTYVAGYQDGSGENWESRRAGITRAWNPPSGFEEKDWRDKIIGINFTQDGKEPKQGYFSCGGGTWRSTVEITSEEIEAPFYLYGYTPHTTGVTCEIQDLDNNTSEASEFSRGAVMTLRNLPVVTSQDLCVVVGAKNGRTDYKADADYSVTGLKQGDFAYTADIVSKDGATPGNRVYLLFDHLYAALRIRMKVDGTYNAMRRIKLKELRLRTKQGSTDVPKKTDVAITLEATNDGTTPIKRDGSGREKIVYTPSGSEVGDSRVYRNSTGLELTTAFTDYFASHFVAQDVTTLILTSVYDVYDTNYNLLREDCEAENTIVLEELISEQTYTLRGRRYSIDMVIMPTYLYVLSDPDLENPMAIVN